LAHVNPMYYAVEAARELASGTLASAAVAEGFAVMGAAALLAIWWSTHAYRRAMA
jgi:ABC-2 type transport system permease protein